MIADDVTNYKGKPERKRGDGRMKDGRSLPFTVGLTIVPDIVSSYRKLNAAGKRKSVDLKTDRR